MRFFLCGIFFACVCGPAMAQVAFVRMGDGYRIDDGCGLVVSGRIGGSRIFRSVQLDGQPIGSFGLRVYYDFEGRRWMNGSRVVSADWCAANNTLTVRIAGKDRGFSFEAVEAIAFGSARAQFRADVLEVANTGTRPFPVKRVYFDTAAPYAAETEGADEKPFVVRDASGRPMASWRARDGRVWGASTDSRRVSTWHCWLGADGTAHADNALILDLNVPLAPGEVHRPAKAALISAVMFAKPGVNVRPPAAPVFADVPGRPRLFLRPEILPRLRDRCADGDLEGLYLSWHRAARQEIGVPLPPEPPWLPKQQPDHAREYARAFRTVRPPTRAMQMAALVYQLGGDAAVGAEAKRRVLYYFGWDPKGPSSTLHNDEPAMSILRNGCRAYDWTYGLYTAEERVKIEACIVERARQVHSVLVRSKFHENPRNSHLGRQIGFLAEACCAIMPEHPEMREWYDYVMDVYRRLYPAWGTEDGGWNEGPHYWSAYMDFGLDSLTAVKLARGEDIVSTKPFFKATPWYFIYQCPPGSPISPFGDGWQAGPQRSTALRSFAVLHGDPVLLWFAERAGVSGVSGVRDLVLDPFLTGLVARPPENLPGTRCFPGEGLVMSHSCLTNAAEDVAFYFRSTPYGAVSHGHADQNAFCLSAYGEPLVIASGYYNYWGSPHHFKWMRQTQAKSAITYDGGKGQPYSASSVGRIVGFRVEGDRAEFSGEATAAYGGALTKARRDVVRLDRDLFLIRDDLASREPRSFEFNLHATDKMRLDEAAQRVTVVRPRATLDLRFVGGTPLRFSQTDRFAVELDEHVLRKDSGYPSQWHFRAATERVPEAEILTLLEVRRPSEPSRVASVRQIDENGRRVVNVILVDGRVLSGLTAGRICR